MSRILFAWELGANFGHVARDLPVATALREQGHDVLFAVRDLRVAQELLAPGGWCFVPAPSPDRDALGHPPINYSEMLLTGGYGDAIGLYGRVNAWAAIIGLHKSDVVVVNHAPTALLAAKIARTPAVMACIGFELPPQSDPLPSIRPWENTPIEQLQRADAAALQAINSVLVSHECEPLQTVASLFKGVPTVLTTFPELDHYGARIGGNYVGPMMSLTQTIRYDWPGKQGARIFAYLRPSIAGCEHLLTALQRVEASVLCVIPGASADFVSRFASPNLKIHTRPADLGAALREADLVVAYGAGTIADALLAGVPLLMVPQVIEQALAAERVEALGAGLTWKPPRTAESATHILGAALEDAQLSTKAKQFAARHHHFNHEQAARRVVDTVMSLLQRKSGGPAA
ncbi:nucleotide disphospho-sugar-binding domain-containing protein [Ralstonia solanacearum species complex bacterium KE056]|uniref:glycosyltransferase n=1 Tax=Ralstonia solanacearum species complex bacterium KE056 TaxID=3119585 RepID=UPI002FC2AC04